MKNIPRWVQIWLLASAIWGAIVMVGTARLILNPPSFEAAATSSRHQLMLRPLPELELFIQQLDPQLFFRILVWRDAKTREELVSQAGRSLPDASVHAQAIRHRDQVAPFGRWDSREAACT